MGEEQLNIINVCGRCNIIITDLMSAIKNGCPNCGARVFKAMKPETIEEKKENLRTEEHDPIIMRNSEHFDDISSIEVSKEGVIMIDLDKLIGTENMENIVIKDANGGYHISLDALRKGSK